jgi:hypothetical protein
MAVDGLQINRPACPSALAASNRTEIATWTAMAICDVGGSRSGRRRGAWRGDPLDPTKAYSRKTRRGSTEDVAVFNNR